MKLENTHLKSNTHPLIYFHIAPMLCTFFSALAGWVSVIPADTRMLSHNQIAVLYNALNATFSTKLELLLQSCTFWSLSKWRMSTKGAMDGRPWAHWKGNWHEDKDATKLLHSSLVRLSLNLMAPDRHIHVYKSIVETVIY